MTTPNHIAQSVIISLLFTHVWIIIVIAGFLGGLWDYFHVLDRKDSWLIYEYYHRHKLWKWFVPFANLHLLEDWFVHDKNGGTNTYYIPAEISLWIIMIIIFIFVIL